MPRRILIAGQDRTLNQRTQLHLVSAGYDTLLADATLDRLALRPADHVDLVILDLECPSLDGLEVLARLRAEPGPVRPAIIVMADVSPSEAGAMAADLGVDSCLSKPVDVDMLLGLVNHTFCPERRASASTWYVDDEPVEPLRPETMDAGVSEPEDPDSVTFR